MNQAHVPMTMKARPSYSSPFPQVMVVLLDMPNSPQNGISEGNIGDAG
jgi:hypothetical protein